MIHILWPENGLKQRPKHVVRLNLKLETESYFNLLITHILLLQQETYIDTAVVESLILAFICLRATTLSDDVAHRTVRSWRQNSFGCFSRWPLNTLRIYMCGVACCRKEWGKALYDKAHWARIVEGGRKTVNRKRKLSAVLLQPI
jgi:hypothetical protein